MSTVDRPSALICRAGRRFRSQNRWEDFFEKFEAKNLAFLYQDEKSSGEESRFFKFISREGGK